MIGLVSQEKQEAAKLNYLEAQYDNMTDYENQKHENILKVNSAKTQNEMLLQEAALTWGVELSGEQEGVFSEALLKTNFSDINDKQQAFYTRAMRTLAWQGKSASQINDSIKAYQAWISSSSSSSLPSYYRYAMWNALWAKGEYINEANLKQISEIVEEFWPNSEQAKNALTSKVVSNLWATQKKEYYNNEKTLKSLSEIGEIMKSMKSYWFTAKTKNWGEKLKSALSSEETDPKKEAARVRILANIQTYRKAITGAAFSKMEWKEFEAMFPSMSQTESVNLARIDAMKTKLGNENETVLEQAMWPSFYNKIYKEGFDEAEIADDKAIASWTATYVWGEKTISPINWEDYTINDLLNAPDGTTEFKTRLREVSPQNGKIRWMECWEFINNIFNAWIWSYATRADELKATWKNVWNNKEDSMDFLPAEWGTINASVWNIVTWNPGDTQWGHVWYVVWEENGKLLVRSSNLTAWTITTVAVDPSEFTGVKYTSLPKTVFQ